MWCPGLNVFIVIKHNIYTTYKYIMVYIDKIVVFISTILIIN